MKLFKKILKNRTFQVTFVLIVVFLLFWYWPQEKIKPNYGVTFSAKYTRELGLNPQETLEVIFKDLNVKKVRLAAYWDEVQIQDGNFNYQDLDWQIEMAKKYNVEVILAVGKRVPRWPECHIPSWVLQLDESKQSEALLKFVRETVLRYKDEDTIKVWQIENEPFLAMYAKQYCGKFDETILDKEIAIVKEIDFDTPVLITDSGELSLWNSSYKRGDQFGSTFYVYTANNYFEDVRSFMSHNSYRYKLFIMNLIHGEKPTYLIEVSIEPWLTKPIINTSFKEQLSKMNVKRAKIILDIASQTGFTEQYLWGPEWWYYLKLNGYPELWDFFKGVNK
jgi:hypothetical protein